MVASFTREKKSELLVVLNKTKDGKEATEYLLVDIKGKNITKLNIEPVHNFQPLVLDFLGTSVNQLIYMSNKNGKPQRVFYSSSTGEVPLSKHLINKKYKNFEEFPISVPHSSSFIDVNGDCIPDIVLTSYDSKQKHFYIEYWLFTKKETYELYDYTRVEGVDDPRNISQLVFADFGTLPRAA